jgi:hypothetical protein
MNDWKGRKDNVAKERRRIKVRNKKEPNKGGKIPMLGFLLFPPIFLH